VPNTFTAGTPALAAEVNANFTNLDTRASTNATNIGTNTTNIATNTTNIAQVLESDGNFNTRAGTGALSVNTGFQNTAFGMSALFRNTTGQGNTATGAFALETNTTGGNNTAVGSVALNLNSTGLNNTAVGSSALSSNTTANFNTAVGNQALWKNTTGSNNTAVGEGAVRSNTTANFNTAVGTMALWQNTIGEHNIAIGHFAGQFLTTGNGNIAISNFGVAGESGTIRIGGVAQTRAFIGGIRGKTTGFTDAVAVLIDSAGQLGTVSSSRRYKEDIEDMAGASAGLLSLRPVTFRYKQAFENGNKPIQYGLIAEEVAEVFPELVVYNEDGEPETVKYRLLSTLLLNELQKQQQVTADQAAQLAAVEMQLAELTALTSRLAQPVTPVSEVQLASN
ncbi:MAG: tail fiber domain-containing protein, partial [Pseudomonadales bacterium]